MGCKLQQLVTRVHWPARSSHHTSGTSDVPRGHFAVYVGEGRRRFVIPTAYLRHPSFLALLKRVEEEFGFDHQLGGLTIPCTEQDFLVIVNHLRSSSVIY